MSMGLDLVYTRHRPSCRCVGRSRLPPSCILKSIGYRIGPESSRKKRKKKGGRLTCRLFSHLLRKDILTAHSLHLDNVPVSPSCNTRSLPPLKPWRRFARRSGQCPEHPFILAPFIASLAPVHLLRSLYIYYVPCTSITFLKHKPLILSNCAPCMVHPYQ